jgi:hypothetical protein
MPMDHSVYNLQILLFDIPNNHNRNFFVLPAQTQPHLPISHQSLPFRLLAAVCFSIIGHCLDICEGVGLRWRLGGLVSVLEESGQVAPTRH